jgi:hypothetical protein
MAAALVGWHKHLVSYQQSAVSYQHEQVSPLSYLIADS